MNTLADAIDEADETVLVNLTNPVGAVVMTAQAAGVILDHNDPPPLSVNNVLIEEATTAKHRSAASATHLPCDRNGPPP